MKSVIDYLYESNKKEKIRNYLIGGVTGGLVGGGIIGLHHMLKNKEDDFDHKKATKDIIKNIIKEKVPNLEDQKKALN